MKSKYGIIIRAQRVGKQSKSCAILEIPRSSVSRALYGRVHSK